MSERPSGDWDLLSEIDNFEAEMQRYIRGELASERFRAFRLAHGIYGQRQKGAHMVRVKVPSGALGARQLLRLADLAARYADGRAHLTTRQDVQMHFVRLTDVPAVMRSLAVVGLTTREACGNSVRNVTACPLAGSIATEVFDVRPCALAVSAFLIRNPFCQQLARKLKIAVSGCPEDCAATAIHDVGLLARARVEGGRALGGFRVVVGGGLGATPFLARELFEFVPAGDLLRVVKAVVKVAGARGNRRNRMRARLKFVVHRIGIEAFRDLVRAELDCMTAAERAEADLAAFLPAPVQEPAPPVSVSRGPLVPRSAGSNGADPEFERWTGGSVRAHRDPARAVVTVMVPLGDLEASTLRALAGLVSAYGGDEARVAVDQNLVLPEVAREDLPALHRGLSRIGLSEAAAGTALDVTSCPGSDTCNLGITSSRGVSRAIRASLRPVAAGGGSDLLRGVTIKVSGCPNACGQHHVAGIGLHGVVKKIGARQAPAYQLHLGGRGGAPGARIGRLSVKLAAKHVPGAVTVLLDLYRERRRQDESFADFIVRVPGDVLNAALAPFAGEAEAASEDLFYDWDRAEPYTTEEMGSGECAPSARDVVGGPLDEVEVDLAQITRFMRRGRWADAAAHLNRAQYTLARALLKPLGKEPESDYETTCELRARVIDRGLAGETWNLLHRDIDALLRARRPDPDALRAAHALALGLLEESRATLGRLSALRSSAAADAEIPR